MGNKFCVVLPKMIDDKVEKTVNELERQGKDLIFVYPTSNRQEVRHCIDVSDELRVFYSNDLIKIEDSLDYGCMQNRPMLLLNREVCEKASMDKKSFPCRLLAWADLSQEKGSKFSYKDLKDVFR